MIKLLDKDFVDPADSDYPYGKIRDRSEILRGTPVDTKTYGDQHQFFEKLMDDGEVVPNGMPENAYSGFQLIQALQQFIGKKINKLLFNTIATGYIDDTVLILYGCNIVANLPGTSSVADGAIYYNGVFYEVDNNASIIASGLETLVWKIDESVQPVKMQLVSGNSGSGLADYSDAKLFSKVYQDNSFFGSVSTSEPFGGSCTISGVRVIKNGNKIKCCGILSYVTGGPTQVITALSSISNSENYPKSNNAIFHFDSTGIVGYFIGTNAAWQGVIGRISVFTNGQVSFELKTLNSAINANGTFFFEIEFDSENPYSSY